MGTYTAKDGTIFHNYKDYIKYESDICVKKQIEDITLISNNLEKFLKLVWGYCVAGDGYCYESCPFRINDQCFFRYYPNRWKVEDAKIISDRLNKFIAEMREDITNEED